jgi:hypothetical protein
MNSYLSIDLNDLIYNRDEFIQSLDIQISAKNKIGRHFFTCSHKLLSKSISETPIWPHYNTDSGGIYIEEVLNKINIKLKEWINIWNINHQYEFFSNFYSIEIESSRNAIFEKLSSERIQEKSLLIEEFKRNINSLGNGPVRQTIIELPPKPTFDYYEQNESNKIAFRNLPFRYEDYVEDVIKRWEKECDYILNKNSNLNETYENEYNEIVVVGVKPLTDEERYNKWYKYLTLEERRDKEDVKRMWEEREERRKKTLEEMKKLEEAREKIKNEKQPTDRKSVV